MATINNPVEELYNLLAQLGGTTPYKKPVPEAKGIIYNPPTTIVIWTDGTKTVVRCDGNDTFSKEFGLAMAYMKKIFGTRNAFKRLISTAYCPQEVKVAKEAKRLGNKHRVEETTKPLEAEIHTVCYDDCTSCTVTDSTDYNTPGAFVTGQN